MSLAHEMDNKNESRAGFKSKSSNFNIISLTNQRYFKLLGENVKLGIGKQTEAPPLQNDIEQQNVQLVINPKAPQLPVKPLINFKESVEHEAQHCHPSEIYSKMPPLFYVFYDIYREEFDALMRNEEIKPLEEEENDYEELSEPSSKIFTRSLEDDMKIWEKARNDFKNLPRPKLPW